MYLLLLMGLAFTLHAIFEEYLSRRGDLPELRGECPSCSEEVALDWLICPRCRALLRHTCSNCQQHYTRWGDYCPLCGTQNETPA